MAHEGSTGLLFPIKQMKNNVVFIESAIVELGDKEALIPIMLDPNNQISFKSGHCQVGDQVVILPAWARKDQFIAIKGWGAYEVASESFVAFTKMDWTYDGYPGRCTTYDSGYIWKERFYWSTIPPIPNGYPTYFKLQVMRKGLSGHPDTLIANWPQNCSDGTAVYSDDINVAYGNTTPYIAEDYPLNYGADYKHYFYTAFPKRDNICAIVIPELGSNYWIDDAFCSAYVEPPEENPKGIAVIQRTTTHEAENSVEEKYATLIALLEELPTFHYETEEELEAFLQEIRDATDALYSEIENYEIENEVWANETKLYWTPTSNDILIRYKKSATPAYIVPDPINLDEGIIEGHGDLLYFGSGEEGQLIHQNLEYNEYYSYTLWNIETRVNEDSEELYVHNRYTGDGYHPYCYPITATVYASVFINPIDYMESGTYYLSEVLEYLIGVGGNESYVNACLGNDDNTWTYMGINGYFIATFGLSNGLIPNDATIIIKERTTSINQWSFTNINNYISSPWISAGTMGDEVYHVYFVPPNSLRVEVISSNPIGPGNIISIAVVVP